MSSRIEITVEKIVDRGPKFGFLEVQVTFEEKALPDRGIGLGYVVVPLSKADTGDKTFEEIRAMAVWKATTFLERCIKSAASRE